jgi:hypothetical protein
MATSSPPTIDIEGLGFDRGAHLLIKRALRRVPVGGRLAVRGRAPDAAVHLVAWCRAQGHEVTLAERGAAGSSRPGRGRPAPLIGWVVRGRAESGRWRGAEPAGRARANEPGAVHEHPPATWGLAARGATVEPGAPAFDFPLSAKAEVWADDAARLYAQAAAAQWDPATAVPWDAPFELPADVEDAVVQIMTYLIENENAALVVPARFLAQIHPHFREVVQVLAVQVADEARHVEIFTRRATLRRPHLGLSTVSGQASLRTLLDERDFAVASFLLSVLGEGTFLNLLGFLQAYGPDPVTRQVARLAAQDEARHVAFGMAHLEAHVGRDPGLRGRLAAAVTRRHDHLRHTAGLNEEVFDALVLLAAGEWTPKAIAEGYARVQALEAEMAAGRKRRLVRLGFDERDAETLAALHTRNFM